MDALLHHLSDWKPFRAVVVGDFMLDELVYGNAQELSRDAPVPKLQVLRVEHQPGSAANVSLCLAALGGRVETLGVVGDDEPGVRLRRHLADAGVGEDGLVIDRDRPTTVKRSLIGLAQQRHPQKMFRVDFESTAPISSRLVDELLARFVELLREADVVCIQDHARGVCTPTLCREVIARARAASKPVFVDPALGADFSVYRGATAITPNRNEAEAATGCPTDPDGSVGRNGAVSASLLEALDLEAVVLTLDRHGALLHRRDCEPEPITTRARSVYDVSGAGDVILAALAAARANAIEWSDAVRFANAAAGLEVEAFGVEPIPLERVQRELIRERSPATGKLRSLEDLATEVAGRHRRGETVVLTNGCFDVIHSGHVRVIEEAARFGDFLIVAVNDDASVSRLKGPDRPINPLPERLRVLAALEGVGAVVPFSEDTAAHVIETLHPDVMVKGGDYAPDTLPESETIERLGGRIEIVPIVEGRSSSETIRRIRSSQ